MNGINICFRQREEATPHLVDLTLCNTTPFYGTTDRMISIKTPKIVKFINITSAVLSQFSDELSEFAETLMNE